MLDSISVSRRPGRFAFVTVAEIPATVEGVEAIVSEAEGHTLVVACTTADARGWHYDFEAAWLTLDVHSALEAVGLTAAVSQVLAAAEIPCNMIAGYYHDHLLVPFAKAAEAIAAVESLARR